MFAAKSQLSSYLLDYHDYQISPTLPVPHYVAPTSPSLTLVKKLNILHPSTATMRFAPSFNAVTVTYRPI